MLSKQGLHVEEFHKGIHLSSKRLTNIPLKPTVYFHSHFFFCFLSIVLKVKGVEIQKARRARPGSTQILNTHEMRQEEAGVVQAGNKS